MAISHPPSSAPRVPRSTKRSALTRVARSIGCTRSKRGWIELLQPDNCDRGAPLLFAGDGKVVVELAVAENQTRLLRSIGTCRIGQHALKGTGGELLDMRHRVTETQQPFGV